MYDTFHASSGAIHLCIEQDKKKSEIDIIRGTHRLEQPLSIDSRCQACACVGVCTVGGQHFGVQKKYFKHGFMCTHFANTTCGLTYRTIFRFRLICDHLKHSVLWFGRAIVEQRLSSIRKQKT